MKCVQIRNFFWSVFSRIRTEYGEIRSISETPYLDIFQAVFSLGVGVCSQCVWSLSGKEIVPKKSQIYTQDSKFVINFNVYSFNLLSLLFIIIFTLMNIASFILQKIYNYGFGVARKYLKGSMNSFLRVLF